MESKKPDLEMLKEIDFLLNMDALDEETDWESLAQMEALEKVPDESKEGSK